MAWCSPHTHRLVSVAASPHHRHQLHGGAAACSNLGRVKGVPWLTAPCWYQCMPEQHTVDHSAHEITNMSIRRCAQTAAHVRCTVAVEARPQCKSVRQRHADIPAPTCPLLGGCVCSEERPTWGGCMAGLRDCIHHLMWWGPAKGQLLAVDYEILYNKSPAFKSH